MSLLFFLGLGIAFLAFYAWECLVGYPRRQAAHKKVVAHACANEYNRWKGHLRGLYP